MENIFLVKLPANVNQRKHIHNNFLSEVSHKIQNFDHQNWSEVLFKKLLFCQAEQVLTWCGFLLYLTTIFQNQLPREITFLYCTLQFSAVFNGWNALLVRLKLYFFFRRMNKGVESLRTNIMKALLTVVTFAVTFHSIYSGRRLWNKSCTRKLMKLYPFKLHTVITFRSNLLYEVFKTEVNVQSSPDVRWNL